ncbi:MAG: sigma-70 family RNA polymerase sigma factor [Bacteroidales bacterium]|nr:sigma-70 family RNA polymerase sigma factor [Bacteroidales bacterium]
MNQKQFLALLEPLQPKLFGFAYRMLRNEEGAKDAMQELTYRLWKRRKKLNTNQNISAYCFQMMHNICIDDIRYNKVKELSSRRKPGTDGESPEVALDHQELIANIRKAVDQLPEKQKAIIELHDFQEFSHQEIATILKMEVNAVRVNLSRARSKIQAQFKKEEIYE